MTFRNINTTNSSNVAWSYTKHQLLYIFTCNKWTLSRCRKNFLFISAAPLRHQSCMNQPAVGVWVSASCLLQPSASWSHSNMASSWSARSSNMQPMSSRMFPAAFTEPVLLGNRQDTERCWGKHLDCSAENRFYRRCWAQRQNRDWLN